MLTVNCNDTTGKLHADNLIVVILSSKLRRKKKKKKGAEKYLKKIQVKLQQQHTRPILGKIQVLLGDREQQQPSLSPKILGLALNP